MLLYKCFCFSEVMNQMFLTVRSAVQGSFMTTLGVALSLFMSSYDQDGELGDVPLTSGFFFGVNLDYLDFSGGIFDL